MVDDVAKMEAPPVVGADAGCGEQSTSVTGQDTGRSPRPRAPFVPGLGYVKAGGRGKNSGNLSIHGAPAASRCEMGEGVADSSGLEGLEMRIYNSACSGRQTDSLGSSL